MNLIKINDDVSMTRKEGSLFVLFSDGRIMLLPDDTREFQYPKLIDDLTYSQNVYEEGEKDCKGVFELITIKIPAYLRDQKLWEEYLEKTPHSLNQKDG